MHNIFRLLRDNRGVSAIEYCVLAALISVALIFALDSLGGSVGGTFNNVEAGLAGSAPGGGEDDDDDDEAEGDGD